MKKPMLGLFLTLSTQVLFGAQDTTASTSSRGVYRDGSNTLVVYNNVPSLSASPYYTIKIRSAATNNVWIDCFANYSRNRASELPDDNLAQPIWNFNYLLLCDGWSHSYGNIEMSPNSPVEVEISSKNGFSIKGQAFNKAKAYPAHKASGATVTGGKVYFTITNPAQITVDINGQMDDYNAAVNPIGAPVHTVTLFANPILTAPTLGSSGVFAVDPGVAPPVDPAKYTTLYFKPGVHNIGINYKIYPGKNYYIPGDAIVYGTFNNLTLPAVGSLQSGENIKIYGYGTISGEKNTHPRYVSGSDEKQYKSITIDNGVNCEVMGVCVADSAFHSVNLNPWSLRTDKMVETTFARWVKVISWRANGDGIGSAHLVEDCFIRTADDCSYTKGNRRRCVFWKDSNAAVFNIAGTPLAGTSFPITVEDCDVIYLRTRGSTGGVFVLRGAGPIGLNSVDVTVKNIRVTDPRPNVPVFNMYSEDLADGTKGSSFSGFKFDNITIAKSGIKQVLTGYSASVWNGGISFNNVIFGDTPLSWSDFTSNSYVSNITFTKTSASLSSPWQMADIGAVAAAGSTTYSNSNWTINGSGADIASTVDECRYVYQAGSGDCSIVARVASLTNTNTNAKAGVMIRETSDANSQGILLAVTPGNNVVFQYRLGTGASTTVSSTVSGQTTPKWLRLTRTGSSFKAERSDDNKSWTQVGTSQTINLATNVVLGLAVTSANDGKLCTSLIDNVSVAP